MWAPDNHPVRERREDSLPNTERVKQSRIGVATTTLGSAIRLDSFLLNTVGMNVTAGAATNGRSSKFASASYNASCGTVQALPVVPVSGTPGM